MSTIPNGAVLALTQHLAEIFQSPAGIDVEGRIDGQVDRFVCSPQADGSLSLGDRFYGRPLAVTARPIAQGMSFKSSGGEVEVDVTATRNGPGYDLLGSIDSRRVEVHCVVHAGIHESGTIADLQFGLNRWAEPDGVTLKGSLGDKPIVEHIHRTDAGAHWTGTCGGVVLDENVTPLPGSPTEQ